MPGTSADVTIWDQRGPSRMQGQFFDYEVGNHDGAYKGYSDCNYIVAWGGMGWVSLQCARSAHAVQNLCQG